MINCYLSSVSIAEKRYHDKAAFRRKMLLRLPAPEGEAMTIMMENMAEGRQTCHWSTDESLLLIHKLKAERELNRNGVGFLSLQASPS